MYVPRHFAPPDSDAVDDLIRRTGSADLVSWTAEGFRASTVPLLLVDGPALHGHLARANDQWRLGSMAPCLAVFRGPDCYVSPTHYPSKAAHGRVVPTWNHLTVHVHGELVVHDDAGWTLDLVRRLTDAHEAGRASPWSVDDAPAEYVDGLLRAIVGIEVRVTRIEASWKLSQNRSAEDRAGVVEGLAAGSPREHAVAAAMGELDAP
jgi:transcriptional regulator